MPPAQLKTDTQRRPSARTGNPYFESFKLYSRPLHPQFIAHRLVASHNSCWLRATAITGKRTACPLLGNANCSGKPARHECVTKIG